MCIARSQCAAQYGHLCQYWSAYMHALQQYLHEYYMYSTRMLIAAASALEGAVSSSCCDDADDGQAEQRKRPARGETRMDIDK